MCWLFHKWGKWLDTGTGDLIDLGVKVGTFIRQERRCLKCNKVELRLEKVIG